MVDGSVAHNAPKEYLPSLFSRARNGRDLRRKGGMWIEASGAGVGRASGVGDQPEFLHHWK